jgi:hypothetical protein
VVDKLRTSVRCERCLHVAPQNFASDLAGENRRSHCSQRRRLAAAARAFTRDFPALMRQASEQYRWFRWSL